MPKYRKTALVDAEQFLPPHSIPVGCFQRGTVADVSAGHGEWMLKTLEGDHALRGGDYICTGPAGEKWNVEQSIFEATYEEVETASGSPRRVEVPFAYCCAEGGGRVDACDCVNKDHGTAWVDSASSFGKGLVTPVDRSRNGGDASAAPFTRAAVPERQAPNPYISGTPL